MLRTNFLITHWESELTSLRQNLSAYDATDPESVHKIRVGIKKLRAYLKLYFLLCKNNDAKVLFKETEEIFSLMGKYRNIEISKQKAKEVAGASVFLGSAYLDWLQRLQDDLPSLHDAISNFNGAGLDQLTIAIKKTTDDLDRVKLFKETSLINYHLLKKVKVSLKHFRRNFHRIRKNLKDSYFLIKILSPGTDFSKKKINMLDKTLQLLGNIQDEEVSLEFIRRYHSTVLVKQPIEALRDFQKDIKARKMDALKKANRKTNKFLKGS